MAGGRGGIGWLILAAALAVPGFLFYNWWSHLKTEHDHSVSQNARKRAEGGVFDPAPSAGRLVNPMASTAAPAGLPTSGAAAKASTAPGLAVASAATLPPAAVPVPGAVKPSAAGGDAPPPAATIAVSSDTTVVLPRDPMMSPLDLVRIQEAALEAEEAKRRLEEEAHRKHEGPRKPKPKVLKPVETHIELQGIVAKPDGENLAIINGSTVNPGDKFSVDGYTGKVAVLKITSSEVILQYQGRKFRMSVNAE
jgi:hypothetical protein